MDIKTYIKYSIVDQIFAITEGIANKGQVWWRETEDALEFTTWPEGMVDPDNGWYKLEEQQMLGLLYWEVSNRVDDKRPVILVTSFSKQLIRLESRIDRIEIDKAKRNFASHCNGLLFSKSFN